MSALLELLVREAAMLVAGSTVLLGIAALTVALTRAPLHRQRLATSAIVAWSVWFAAAVLPLPRWRAAAEPVIEPRAAFAEPMLIAPPPVAAPRLTLAPPGPVAGRPWPIAEVLASGYVGGAALAILHVLAAALALHRCLRRSRPAPAWLEAIARTASADAAVRMPRLRIAARAVRPFCCGVRTPTIVLPPELALPQRAGDAQQIVLHELGHLRQGDPRAQVLFACALPLLFWHPLYWWLRRVARVSAELVADEWAASRSSRAGYARAMIDLSERLRGRAPALAGTVPMFVCRSEFYRRMKMLLERERPLLTTCSTRRRRAQWSGALLLAALTASVFGARELPAQQDERAVQRELEQLRAERQKLEAELRDLREEIGQLDPRRPPPAIADTPEPPPPQDPRTPLLPRVPTLGDLFARQAPVPVAPLLAPEPPEPAEPAVSTQALDLATRAIEARGECRLCAGDLARVHQLAEEGQAPRHEVQRAKIRLEVAEQKLDVVMRALQAEEGALQREIARVRRDRSLKRDERERAQARIEGNLEILRSAR